MRAGLLYGPRELRVAEVDKPSVGPGQVLVEVKRFAPYGTDLGLYLGRGGRFQRSYPVGIGADFSGVIAEIGAEVEGFGVGDRVSALALAHCGACRNCRAGRTNLCLDPEYVTKRQECCADLATVDANKLAKLPAEVSFEDAAMLGGIVDALNAFEMIRPRLAEQVAIVGVGAMGWGAIATARAVGARVIAVGGTGRKRVELARVVGADEVVSLERRDEDVTGHVLELAPGGIDCVMETTASDWGVRQAIAIAAAGARVALTGGGDLGLTAWAMVRKELSVYGVRGGHHQELALRLIAQGRIDLKPTITHRMPLEEAPAAFELLAGPEAKNVGRIMIEVSD
jgi:threonine dehydrogenase-like Zn-dependent dehydrogenase